jgi:arylsulfatase A-like enzyme
MSSALTRRSALGAVVGAAGASSLPPNVLMIAVDDLKDWIGCLGGHPDARTPNLDRLARRGVLFHNAYCNAPLCNPSRTSILTGLLPSTTGCYQNTQPIRRAFPNIMTLPGYFKQHGYYTLGYGKIFHFHQADGAATWNEYIAINANNQPPGRPGDWRLDGGPMDITDDEMGDGKTANWAVQQLQRSFDRPFFLAAGIFRPHECWFAPRKYFELYPTSKIRMPKVNERDLDDIPPVGREIAQCIRDFDNVRRCGQERYAVAAYLACVSFADAMIGRILDGLERSRYRGNTIVLLWSDNGFHLGTKLHWRKFTLWEESTRIPLMIAAPGVTKPGGVCRRPVGLIDLFPTLVDLCQLPKKEDLDGQSLIPLLRDPSRRWGRPALTTYGRNNHAIRTERWRYIRYSDGGEELYDHGADPLEWRNLAQRAEYAKLKSELARWFPEKNAANIPDSKGNTDIKPWHVDYAHLRGRPIQFIPW